MIRIYPSRLPGEPLETHRIGGPVQLDRWLSDIVGQEVSARDTQPVTIEVNGREVDDFAVLIQPDDDVRIYPIPYATGAAIAAWAALAIAAVALVYALTLDTDTGTGGRATGDQMDLNPAKANGVKLHQPVREILGQARVYPDYAVQPVSRFVDKRSMQTNIFLSVGSGRHSILPSSIKIGDTPLAAFGTDADYTLYEPGANVSGDARTECWYSCGEVGGTDAGTAGLDTASTAPGGTGIIASALVLAGNSLALAGDEAAIPDVWDVGTLVFLETPNTYTVSKVGGYNRIAGPLDELAPFVGQRVTLGTDIDDIALVVASYSPYAAPVEGVGGSPTAVIASAAPTTYSFAAAPAVWSITYQGNTRAISLAADYGNMSSVVAEITAQLSGMGLVAQDSSGRLRIVEPSSPYQGGVLSQAGAPVELFGSGPTYTVGTASSGGTPEQLAFVTLRYDSGAAFVGLPIGQQRLSLGYQGNQYSITAIDGLTLTLQRLTDTGAVDTAWPGFAGRTLTDFSLTSDETGEFNWLGPFNACPEGETVRVIEYDIYFPRGLGKYSKKGRLNQITRVVALQWRDTAGGDWNEVRASNREATADAMGFTYRITLPYAMRPQVRLRRTKAPGDSQTLDTIYWYGLRARLSARPAAYSGVTTMALTVRTGDRLGAQSDRKINLVATRLYDEGATRSITGAVLCVLDSLGISRSAVDVEQLQALESAYWTPRGEKFDYAVTEQSAMRDVLQMIFAAGMGHLVLSRGLISATREGVQPPKGMVTPHEMTAPLAVGFAVPSPDDFDGVDVEYTDATSWATETVQCRLPGSQGAKVEKHTVEGVTDRTRAWRIGMRRLRKHTGQRLSFDCSTEMDALCYEYLDHVVLADDIPGTTQSALIVDAEWLDNQVLLTLTEALDWSVSNPRCLIRRHDGTVTTLATPARIDGYTLAVPESLIDFDLITDLSIEPARLLFASSAQVGYPALISSIDPGADGGCSITAVQYSDDFYADDNKAPT